MKKRPSDFLLSVLLSVVLSSCSKNSGSAIDSNSNPPPTDTTVSSGPVVSLRAALPGVLKESSGLCYTDGRLWSFGDSGNPNELFQIDTLTGEIRQTVVVDNFPNHDWEDITADSAFIYIGDFGNNSGNRTDLKIIRIARTALTGTDPVIHVSGDSIHFSYADQTSFESNDNNNFDCESLIARDSSLYIFTKDGGDLRTRCYRLPKHPGSYSVSPLGTFNSQGKITAASYDEQSGQLLLLGYMNKKVGSFLWRFSGVSGNDFFNAKATRFEIGDQNPWQTEGLARRSGNSYFLSCESSGSRVAALYLLQFP